VTIAPSVLPGTSDSAYSADALGQAVTRPAAIHSQPITYIFFNLDEVELIEAAVARLIPADDRWPGALEVGVTNYMDKQMGGAWGAGERLYRSGPWQAGTPSQGYQLPLTPAELFRTAIAAINKELAAKGTPFAAMTPANQDAYLKELETTDRDLGGVPASEFFGHLWEATVEGFFGDPVYGGNRDMIAWRMIGFPGAYASYYDVVDKHGIVIDRPPMSLAQDAMGHIHLDPNIPPKLP
jgi:gluconate 2-dehydrogenase gamma chain